MGAVQLGLPESTSVSFTSGRIGFFVGGSPDLWLWSCSRNFKGLAGRTKKTSVFYPIEESKYLAADIVP